MEIIFPKVRGENKENIWNHQQKNLWLDDSNMVATRVQHVLEC